MRAWPVARSIFDAPYVREANEGTTSWITARGSGVLGRMGAFLDGPGGLGAGPPSAGGPSPKAEPEDLST